MTRTYETALEKRRCLSLLHLNSKDFHFGLRAISFTTATAKGQTLADGLLLKTSTNT